MNVVLFGAGASYGSSHISPHSPPLGKDLFPFLVKRFPNTWGSLPEEYMREFQSGNFEAGTLAILDNKSNSPKSDIDFPLMMRQMCMFFLSFLPDHSSDNSYSRFLITSFRTGILDRVVLSTLNYECLLETACFQLGLPFAYFYENKKNEHGAAIWKLHGSCNFIPSRLSGIVNAAIQEDVPPTVSTISGSHIIGDVLPTVRRLTGSIIIGNVQIGGAAADHHPTTRLTKSIVTGSVGQSREGAEFKLNLFDGRGATVTSEIIALSPNAAIDWCQSEKNLFPAICLYSPDKRMVINPEQHDQIQKQWAQVVLQARSVVVVGVRPNLVDQHIWKPLSETEARLYFVGSRDSFEKWKPVRKHSEPTFLGETFESTVEAVVDALDK